MLKAVTFRKVKDTLDMSKLSSRSDEDNAEKEGGGSCPMKMSVRGLLAKDRCRRLGSRWRCCSLTEVRLL